MIRRTVLAAIIAAWLLAACQPEPRGSPAAVTAAPARCGDGACDALEQADPAECPADCPPASVGPLRTPGRALACAASGAMCGGLAGILCCPGLTCRLEGGYPDASGTCTPAGDTYEPDGTAGLTLLNQVDIPGGARPEVVATNDRVFVLYLEPSPSGNVYKLRVYTPDLAAELAAKTVVGTSPDYGNPTDLRVAAEGDYLYAFYETLQGPRTYLFGAKYRLDDGFEQVAIQGPIATSAMFKVAKPGDEKLDDPAPMVADDGVYVLTRVKSTLAIQGETRYRIRRFDRDLRLLTEFDLDLSAYADGEARQSSLLSWGGSYYLATVTTTGVGDTIETVEWTAPSDVMLVRLDRNWKVQDSKVIAAEPGYTEGYVSGLKTDGSRFYMTYNRVILGQKFTSVIAVYDQDWNRVLLDGYKNALKGLRPSLEVTADRIYAGNNLDQGTSAAQIYAFAKP